MAKIFEMLLKSEGYVLLQTGECPVCGVKF
jgi:hypothetical protein